MKRLKEFPTSLVWSADSTLLGQSVVEPLPRAEVVSDSKSTALSGKCPASSMVLEFELSATLSVHKSHVVAAVRPGRLWAGFRSCAQCCPEWRTWAS